MSYQDERIFVRIKSHDGVTRDWAYMDKRDAQNAADVLSVRPDVKSAEVITVNEKRDQLSDALNTLATSIEKLCEAIEQRWPQQPAGIVRFDQELNDAEYREVSEQWRRDHAELGKFKPTGLLHFTEVDVPDGIVFDPSVTPEQRVNTNAPANFSDDEVSRDLSHGVCYAKWNDGFRVHECTRLAGHDGDHETAGTNRHAPISWPAIHKPGDGEMSDDLAHGAPRVIDRCRTTWSSAGDEPGTVNTCGKSDAYHSGAHIDFTTGARLPRFRVRP